MYLEVPMLVGTVAHSFSQCSYVPNNMECCTNYVGGAVQRGKAISQAEMLIGDYTFSECMAKCKVGGKLTY